MVTLEGWIVPLVLGLITVLVFLPVLWNDFVAWDDPTNLIDNLEYRGFGWKQLHWMLTTVHMGHYVPLTWLSFDLDYALWGMNPLGYHLTNLLLHAAGVVLFYLVARALLAKATAFSRPALVVGAATAAMFFGIHPLRVESVAWATERRDVLSGALFLLTIWLYLGASEAQGPRRRRLLSFSVAAHLLALASKAIVMTLPLVLILLDVYPLRRLQASPGEGVGRLKPLLWEKLPYLALSAAGAVIAYLAHAVFKGPSLPYWQAPWSSRAANIAYTLWFLLLKTAIPAGLSPLYEAPARIDPLDPRFLTSAAGVVGLSALAILLWKRWPGGLAVWAYYGIVLAPVSGVVPKGFQLTADRYSYLACLGWALLVGAGAGWGVEAATRGAVRRPLARLATAVGVLGLLGLGTLTWQQVEIWHDSESLWRHAVTVAPDCGWCHMFLGAALASRGAMPSALAHFQQAAALRPDRVDFRAPLGWVLVRLGMWPEAADQYRLVLERQPENFEVRRDLAVVLHVMGRDEEAMAQLHEAIRINPENPEVRMALGVVLSDMGEAAEAAEHFRRAIELKPDSALARLGLVQAYAALGRKALAREQYKALRALNPGLAAGVNPHWLLRVEPR